MQLREAQARIDAYISQFEEGYFPPLVNLARLAEEVGELARELNHRCGPKTRRKGDTGADLELELGDVLFVVMVLANQLGIELDDALEQTLNKYEVRDAERWRRKGRGQAPAATG